MWKALSLTFSTTVKEVIEKSRHFSEDLEMTNRYGKRYNHYAHQSNLTEALFHSSYSAFSQKREKNNQCWFIKWKTYILSVHMTTSRANLENNLLVPQKLILK